MICVWCRQADQRDGQQRAARKTMEICRGEKWARRWNGVDHVDVRQSGNEWVGRKCGRKKEIMEGESDAVREGEDGGDATAGQRKRLIEDMLNVCKYFIVTCWQSSTSLRTHTPAWWYYEHQTLDGIAHSCLRGGRRDKLHTQARVTETLIAFC